MHLVPDRIVAIGCILERKCAGDVDQGIQSAEMGRDRVDCDLRLFGIGQVDPSEFDAVVAGWDFCLGMIDSGHVRAPRQSEIGNAPP